MPSTIQGHHDSGAPDIIPDIDYDIGVISPDIWMPDVEPDIEPVIGRYLHAEIGIPDIEPDIEPDIGILYMPPAISGYPILIPMLIPISGI